MSRVLRPVPNRKIFHEPANSGINHSYMDPAEMKAKYGEPLRPWKRGWRG